VLGRVVATDLLGADRRLASIQRMRARLDPYGIKLVIADLGRNATQPVWVLTVQLPDGAVQTLHAPVPPQPSDPHAPSICDEVADRVVQHFQHPPSDVPSFR
jgi:hypothetical protein